MNPHSSQSSCEVIPTIFVIDDDSAIRDSVVVALRELKTPIEVFDCVETFLDQWNGPRPGCLILDIRMPGMSGLELQRLLAIEHDYLCTIIVSGYATIATSVIAMKNGAFDFLEKPYLPEQLRARVRQALERANSLWQRRQSQLSFELLKASLSPRELDVYQLLIEGEESKQIARTLKISASTVEKHRLAVLRKMNVESVTKLIRKHSDAATS
jgi:two-component system, LuxR family, response regulator FixJ